MPIIRRQKYNLTDDQKLAIRIAHEKKLQAMVRYKVIAYTPDGKEIAALELPLGEVQDHQYYSFWDDKHWENIQEMMEKFFDEVEDAHANNV